VGAKKSDPKSVVSKPGSRNRSEAVAEYFFSCVSVRPSAAAGTMIAQARTSTQRRPMARSSVRA
jgi:hypothetical protein